MSKVNPIPPGFHTMTPSLAVHDAKAAIEFYKKAFGAELRFFMPGPGGQGVAHAELKIGDSILFLNDEFPGECSAKSPKTLGGTTQGVTLYVEDCDALHRQAVAAGARSNMEPADMFWGDRMSQVVDPFGHIWGISTHKEDLTEQQIAERSAEFWKSFAATHQ